MSELINKVETVYLAINKMYPPQLYVSAAGEVSSSGWKSAELAPRLYLTPPADGVQDIDFLATRPSNINLPMLLPITGDISLTLVEWLKGVRVHSSTNTVTTLLTDLDSVRELAGAPEQSDPAKEFAVMGGSQNQLAGNNGGATGRP